MLDILFCYTQFNIVILCTFDIIIQKDHQKKEIKNTAKKKLHSYKCFFYCYETDKQIYL